MRLGARAIQAGLLPISIGLIGAERLRGGIGGLAQFCGSAITLGTAIVTYMTRLNPLWIFAAAAILGLIGLL